jgi:hypothetical protein
MDEKQTNDAKVYRYLSHNEDWYRIRLSNGRFALINK